ncbi:pre-toxin TG domain-containing protein, partial [Salinimicrobium profundisediminis]
HGISSVPDGEEADENVNSCAAPEVETEDVEEGNDTAKEVGSVVLDFIPGVSNVKSGAEALIGKDLITGRELAGWERGVLVAGIFGGPIVKGAKKVIQWGGDLFGKVKNVLNPDRVKETFDLIYKKTTKAYDTFRNSAAALMKKIGDIEIPTPSFAYAGGVKGNSTTVAEGLKQAKDTIVEMAGKVKDG